jgi:3-hydroxyacyl-CoA dehydrogenase / enoyl-CoA hydratase / 3-hydroxybutyryl-CoA epimerase / enoyl-CoA isomerase
MLFEGRCLHCPLLDGGIAELCLDLQEGPTNLLTRATLEELAVAVGRLKETADLRGLLLSSAKDTFAAGADVKEFLESFRVPEDELAARLLEVDGLFNALEDAPFPVVAALNGFTFGGGLEFALAAGYRVLSSETRIGLPETKLGLFPGWGGTVRLSRLAGADHAIAWIASGEQHPAGEALAIGAVDAVVAPGRVREAALDLLIQARDGRRDWKARRLEKISPLKLNPVEARMVFEGARALVAGRTGPNYPAPLAAIDVLQRGATLGRDEAQRIEATTFARLAKSPTAACLISIFLADKAVGRLARRASGAGVPVRKAAVLGAGIMGGGIACQSALKGTPIRLKEVQEAPLAQGLAEIGRHLAKRVDRGRLSPIALAETFGRIRPTLAYGDFPDVDLAVEAVVESEAVKRAVLAETEDALREDAILASNTSTLSITRLAEGLHRPENFCGMHFFNPVARMPLVEVVRGARSSDRAVATAVGYALALGKTPIVVGDCAGFLVNRVLFPYFAGFQLLVEEGIDIQRIDRVLETFGWPMGPAQLLDVVGLDTARNAQAVMGAAYPDRMASTRPTAVERLHGAGRLGQKNGRGFYAYEPGRDGSPVRTPDPQVPVLLAPLARRDAAAVPDADIVDRLMIPMVLEASRCLEERIVATPAELDLALVYGLGFPPFRGGLLRHADTLGLGALCGRAEAFGHLGPLYQSTPSLRSLAARGGTFHEEA